MSQALRLYKLFTLRITAFAFDKGDLERIARCIGADPELIQDVIEEYGLSDRRKEVVSVTIKPTKKPSTASG